MNPYEKAKRTNRAAAASLVQIAKAKAVASGKTTAEVTAEAPAQAAAERWNETPGPR